MKHIMTTALAAAAILPSIEIKDGGDDPTNIVTKALDDLTKSVDYARLAERVQEIAVTVTYNTIEALAHAIAMACLNEFKRLQKVTVTVEKPGAAIVAILEGISVEVTRVRQDG